MWILNILVSFELIFEKLPSLAGDEVMNHPKSSNFENYANEHKTRLKHALESAKNLIETIKNKRSIDSLNNTNNRELKVGDLVLVKTANRRKHKPPYDGAYEIIDIDDSNVLIKIKTNITQTVKNKKW